jgi:hypothetical protein
MHHMVADPRDSEIIGREVNSAIHTWQPYAGMFKDDSLFDEWQQAIAAYRREVHTNADTP